MPRRWVLDESENPTRHELRSTYRCATAGYFGNRDHPPASRDLHPSPCTGGFNLVRAHIATGIDDDLDAVTFHVLPNLQRGGTNPWPQPA